MAFAPRFVRQTRLPPSGCVYVADNVPDQRGANDTVLFGRRGEMPGPGMKLPYVVSAYVTPPWNVNLFPGTNHRKSRSTPFEATSGIDATTKLMPVYVLSWKLSNFS